MTSLYVFSKVVRMHRVTDGGTLFTKGGQFPLVHFVRGDTFHWGRLFPPTPVNMDDSRQHAIEGTALCWHPDLVPTLICECCVYIACCATALVYTNWSLAALLLLLLLYSACLQLQTFTLWCPRM